MSSLPPAIVFVNGDLSFPPTPPIFIGTDPAANLPSELTTLQTQLFIDDTMTKAEFDARMVADPNYATIVHLRGLRILVILPTFRDHVNRELADVTIFIHAGLADVECNRFGPPIHNFPVQRLTMYELLRAAGSSSVVILPFGVGLGHCDTCHTRFFCDRCHTFSGIKICKCCGGGCKCGCGTMLIDNQGREHSPIHLPNCDAELNNHNFIHRK